MNRLRLVLMITLPMAVVALGAMVAGALIRSYEGPQPQPVVERPTAVNVILAERVSQALVVTAEGTVAPRTESQLVPEVSGRVVEVSPSLAVGGFFDEGDVLLRIESRVYELAETRAKSAVEQAKLRLLVEREEAAVAKKEWEALGTGEPSPLLLREPQIVEIQSSLESAEAALEQARYDLERTVLKAPFAGRVRSKQVDVGQFVQRGVAVATLYSVDVAEVRLPIPNAELEFCSLPLAYRDGDSEQEGPAVKLISRFAGRDHVWQGRIVRTEGEIDPRTRMVHAVAQVKDPYARGRDSRRPPLAVGMFVKAEIQGNWVRNVVRMPRTALHEGDVVYVVAAGSRLRFRQVDVLRRERDSVLIRGGLEDDDRIIVSPLEAVMNGMVVEVLESPGAEVAEGEGK